jgi:hypothetical protein
LNSISAIKKKEIESRWAAGFRTVRTKKLKKHADQGLSPISGKPDNILLSIVVGYCILIAFLFLGNVCLSVCSFDIAVCSINWARILVNSDPSTTS